MAEICHHTTELNVCPLMIVIMLFYRGTILMKFTDVLLSTSQMLLCSMQLIYKLHAAVIWLNITYTA